MTRLRERVGTEYELDGVTAATSVEAVKVCTRIVTPPMVRSVLDHTWMQGHALCELDDLRIAKHPQVIMFTP